MAQEEGRAPAAYEYETIAAPAYFVSGSAESGQAESPVLAPINFKINDSSASAGMAPPIDFRIPRSPAIAPAFPFAAPFAPFMFPTFPTLAPAPPTNAPVYEPTSPGSCYSDLNRLDEDERNATDLDVVRNYVLCPNTLFVTDVILIGDEPESVPLTLRKNMHIYCGEIGGSSDNNCTITGGTSLTSIPNNFVPPTFNDNVLIQGVTFDASLQYAALIALPGRFQFIDCIFSVSRLCVEIMNELYPLLVLTIS